MVKKFLPALAAIFFLSSCSTFKPLNFTSNKQVAEVASPAPASGSKFIDNISVTASTTTSETKPRPEPIASDRKVIEKKALANPNAETPRLSEVMANRTPVVESASEVQLKYAVLLDTEVESLPDRSLLEAVDEWYGVRYRVGGNTKKGIDCSGFTVAVYAAAYGLMIPRISREQYRTSRKISTTELQEGDLVFFNTNGRGVSHVGVYLGNNKFIHASVSRGVMVNDLFETYYLKRYIGAGRIDDKQIIATNAPIIGR
jgi:lipoprotein Spr